MTIQLFERRVSVCNRYSRLKEKFLPALEVLGVDGMSDNEEGHLPVARQYAIVTPAWRAPAVIPFLRILDLLYIGGKFKPDGTAARGNWVRVRKPSSLTSEGNAVTHLPETFYNSVWVEKLCEEWKEGLHMQPALLLKIPNDIRRFVNSII